MYRVSYVYAYSVHVPGDKGCERGASSPSVSLLACSSSHRATKPGNLPDAEKMYTKKKQDNNYIKLHSQFHIHYINGKTSKNNQCDLNS